MTRRLRGCLCAALPVGIALAFAGSPRVLQSGTAQAPPAKPARVPTLEARAPGLFDPASAQLRGQRVRYRVDADILLPLVLTSIHITSRSDVGWVTAGYRDCAADADAVLRGYELFSASRPERARGLNRQGFFREAVRIKPGGAVWTAYFGAMSYSPEQSYGEAEKALNAGRPQAYEITDGLATAEQARALVFRVVTESPASDASDLYAALRPLLAEPRRSPSVDAKPSKTLPTLAFLGALETSLQAAAAAPGHIDPKKKDIAFIHSGGVKVLELKGMSRDTGRGKRLASGGFVRTVNDVYSLDYRITTSQGTDSTFRMWVELPAAKRDPDLPLVPISWEFQARSFLRLVAERTQ